MSLHPLSSCGVPAVFKVPTVEERPPDQVPNAGLQSENPFINAIRAISKELERMNDVTQAAR